MNFSTRKTTTTTTRVVVVVAGRVFTFNPIRETTSYLAPDNFRLLFFFSGYIRFLSLLPFLFVFFFSSCLINNIYQLVSLPPLLIHFILSHTPPPLQTPYRFIGSRDLLTLPTPKKIIIIKKTHDKHSFDTVSLG